MARDVIPTLGDTVNKIFTSGFGTVLLTLHSMWSAVSGEDSLWSRIGRNPSWFMAEGESFNDPATLELEIGAATGVGTARGLAGIFSLYAQGKLVTKGGDVWQRVLEKMEIEKRDLVIPFSIDWNYGYWLARTPDDVAELGHPGYGGQNVKVVPEEELSYAYLTNGLTPDMGDDALNFAALRKAVFATLAEIKSKR